MAKPKKIVRTMDLKFLKKIGEELEEILEPTDEDGEPVSLTKGTKLAAIKKKIMEACEALTSEDEISEDLEWALAEFGMALEEEGDTSPDDDDEDDDDEDDDDEDDDEDDDDDEEEEDTPKKGQKKPLKKKKPADDEDDDDADDEEIPIEDQIRSGKLADLKLIVQEDDTFKSLRKFIDGAKGLEGTRELKAKMLTIIGADTLKPKTKKTSSGASDKKGPTKVGVIAAIVETISQKPVTKAEILKALKKRFPDRDEEAMKKTINVQVPNRIKTEKNDSLTNDDDGKWFFKKTVGNVKKTAE